MRHFLPSRSNDSCGRDLLIHVPVACFCARLEQCEVARNEVREVEWMVGDAFDLRAGMRHVLPSRWVLARVRGRDLLIHVPVACFFFVCT